MAVQLKEQVGMAAQEMNVSVTVISFPDWLPQGVLSKASTVNWSIEAPL